MLVFVLLQVATVDQITPAGSPYRFVIYQPGTQSVSLMGSFSDWKALQYATQRRCRILGRSQ